MTDLKKIIVVGGAGYVGSHTCKLLKQQGHTVVCVDNLSTSPGWHAYSDHNCLVDCVTEPDRLSKVFEQHQDAHGVIHFAARAYVGESVQLPLEYYHNNVTGSVAVIANTLKLHNPCLVFSSSCATYGVPESAMPITEHTPQQPVNPYGRSKLMVEQIIRDTAAATALRGVMLRYFNAAGCDPAGELGEQHDPETHAIPLLIDSVLQRTSFVIHGTDYDTEDGTAVRDYVHVADLAQAHVQALEYLWQGGSTEAFNLGTGTGTSVQQLVNTLVSTGCAPAHCVNIVQGNRRPGDPPELVADAQRAQCVLGWQPQYNLNDMITHAWQWRKQHETQLQ